MLKINIPEAVSEVIRRLEKSGYEAYIVGGCVRDALMGKEPHDFDVTTAALPDQVIQLFLGENDFRTVPTGISHGTVTVIFRNSPIEVTTFRIDGEYSDSRHPDSVTFTDKLTLDLSRRDFTVNAMAYSDTRGLIDPLGGVNDLEHRIIRCVGDPHKRFGEDALRILRALRFAATLGFTIDADTKSAALELSPGLSNISGERIGAELSKLFTGKASAKILHEFLPIISRVLPDARLENIDAICSSLYALEAPPLALALAAIFADTPNEALCKGLDRLHFDKKTSVRCKVTVSHLHDAIDNEIALKRLVCDIGIDSAYDVIRLGIARGEREPQLLEMLDRIKSGDDCLSLASLAASGNDIAALGARGRQIGIILNDLLDAVICGDLPNDRVALLSAARQLINRKDQHK